MTREQNILLMGILSIACCGVLGPITWVRANNIQREIDGDLDADSSERNLLIAGRICAMVGTWLWVLAIVGCLLDVAATNGQPCEYHLG